MKVAVPCTIESVSTRMDNTIKIVIATQDLPPEDAVILFQLKGSLGYMMFSKEFETEMPENLPKPQAMEGKTPSQRLRDRMFVYFKEANIKNTSFDNWYVNEVDRIGQAYLDKLNK